MITSTWFGELENTCKKHLIDLKLLLKHGDDPGITEKELIENCSNKQLLESDCICAFHKYFFGTYYRHSLKCFHPEHISHPPGLTTRAATLCQLSYLQEKNLESYFPSGGQLCMTHIKQINQEIENAANTNLNESTASEYSVPNHEMTSFEDVEKSEQIQSELSNTLDVSPSWRLKRKSVEDLTHNSVRSLKSKYRKAKSALKERFAESIAPGQASDLADILSSSEEENTEELSDDAANLLEIFNSSDKFGKLVALSLVSKTLSKTVIMETFNCSKRQVDNARKLQVLSNGIQVPESTKCHRFRMDMNKCEHFLDFIFSNGMLQDVAYGTSTLKYENGENQTVPHAIIVARFKHIIAYDFQFCSNESFQPLSESSLYKILRELNPSQRKSLAGLDDTTAEGLNGFKTLENIVSNFLGHKRHFLDRLEHAKRYLKIVHPQNCQDHSECPTHCISLALSDPNVPNLQRSRHCSEGHSESCSNCSDLHNLLDEFVDLGEGLSNDLSYDIGI
jgi:hypothetical protein